jgi:O-antigen/teichoic acid export membrane protein
VAWAIAGNAAYGLSQWATVIVLAKLGDQIMVGVYALAMAFTAPFMAMSLFQLRGVMVTEVGRRYPFRDFLGLRLAATGSALLLAGVVAARAGYSGTEIWTIVAVGAARFVDALCDIYYGRWQAGEALDRVSKSLFVNGIVSVLAVALALRLWNSVVGAGLASATGSVCALAYAVMTSRAEVTTHAASFRARIQSILGLAWLSAPLGIVMALMAVQTNIPRYFIEHELGTGALGAFAAASQLTMAGGNIVAAMAAAVSPRLARFRAAEDSRSFESMLWRLGAFGLLLGILGALLSAMAGRWILRIVYRPEYEAAAHVLVWLSISAGLTYAGSFLGYGMTIVGRIREQVPLFAVATLACFASSLLLVPRWGLDGAAVAAGIASGVQVFGSVALIRQARWSAN